jgi:tRNA threonylcarbamoyladenosine biosynthesis protein TsaB
VIVLGLDTATTATSVALLGAGEPREARHDPGPGERPGHTSQGLTLAHALLADAGLRFADVQLLAVGRGPGSFTGLRIGIATANALAQATGAPLRGVSSLHALALPAADGGAPSVLAVLDARRGEAFAAGYEEGLQTRAPAALAPEALAALAAPARPPWLAVGDGAVRFREVLEHAGCTVAEDPSPLHRVSAVAVCRLAAAGGPQAGREAVAPEYLRSPDAVPRPNRPA